MFDRLLKRRMRWMSIGMARWPRNGVATSPTAPSSRCLGTLCERIASYTLLIAKALRLAKRPGELITRTEIKAAADRWFNRRSGRPRKRKNRYVAGQDIHGPCRSVAYIPGAVATTCHSPATVRRSVAQFTDYMVRERGLSPRTVAYSRGTIQKFLAQIDKADLQLKTLTAAERE